MSHRFIATVEFPATNGRMKPGIYAIPGEISMADAKAYRADGFGTIERDAQIQPDGGVAIDPPAMFPPGYEHKEQSAAPVKSPRGRKRKSA